MTIAELDKFEAFNKLVSRIGFPIDSIIIPEISLFSLNEKDPKNALLLGSEIAAKEPYLIQGSIDQFLTEAPLGYFLIGYWGHGINSYAFYYQIVSDKKRIFFRLPLGGAYANEEDDIKELKEFLNHYFTFEQEVLKIADKVYAVNSMGEERYQIIKDKKIIGRGPEDYIKDRKIFFHDIIKQARSDFIKSV